MNDTQRKRIEKTWTPEGNMSIPHYIQIMEAALVGFAKKDLKLAEKPGGNIIAGTHLGNIEVSKGQDAGYYLMAYRNGAEFMRVPMKKASAIEFLVNAYRVEPEGA